MPPEDFHQRRQRPRNRSSRRGQSDSLAAKRVSTNKVRHLRLVPDPDESAQTANGLEPEAIASQPTLSAQQQSPQSLSFPGLILLRWVVRIAVGSVGTTVIAGTVLALLGGPQYVENPTPTVEVSQVSDSLEAMTRLPLGEEINPLQERITAIAQKAAPLDPSIFVLDLDTGAYLNYKGGNPLPSASTIKLPILVAFFQDIDNGKIDPKEMLVMEPELIAGGSGNMQYSKPGTKFTALETATRMITISDNTATNMLIKRLGGINLLNQRFGSWGLNATAIHERLPDLTGQNQTSAVDLAHLLVQVNQGELISLPARDQMLAIMRQVKNDALLPKGIDSKATIAHKTGNIKSMLADVGIVDTPMGRRYAVIVMVNRPDNDLGARGLIQTLSREVYQHFQQPVPQPSPSVLPEAEGAIAEDPPPKVEANVQP